MKKVSKTSTKYDPMLGRHAPVRSVGKPETTKKKTKRPRPRPQLFGLPPAFHDDKREDIYYGD